jgi:hypothetical protein
VTASTKESFQTKAPKQLTKNSNRQKGFCFLLKVTFVHQNLIVTLQLCAATQERLHVVAALHEKDEEDHREDFAS